MKIDLVNEQAGNKLKYGLKSIAFFYFFYFCFAFWLSKHLFSCPTFINTAKTLYQPWLTHQYPKRPEMPKAGLSRDIYWGVKPAMEYFRTLQRINQLLQMAIFSESKVHYIENKNRTEEWMKESTYTSQITMSSILDNTHTTTWNERIEMKQGKQESR